jgi:hypothetical protein
LPLVAIVEALAEAAVIDPIDLPLLNEFVDPDALDQLFGEHAVQPARMLPSVFGSRPGTCSSGLAAAFGSVMTSDPPIRDPSSNPPPLNPPLSVL